MFNTLASADSRLSTAWWQRLSVHVGLWVTLSVAVIGAGPVFAAGGSGKTLIGFAQDTFANDWRLAQVRALQEAFATRPDLYLIVTDAHGDTARQISDVEDLVRRGVKVLVVSPRDERAMTPVIEKVYHSGIPVVLLTRRINGNAYTTLVAPDDAAIARRAAEALARLTKGRARILMLRGLPTASTTKTRTKVFLDTLKRYPGMHVVAAPAGNYLRGDTITAMEEVLNNGTQFDALYAESDSMAEAARIVLRKAGYDLHRLPSVGIDYIRSAREAIRTGEQSMSFTYPTCAREAFIAVSDILAGRTPPHRIVVESTMVTRDNVEHVQPIF